jgi:hypothetical protein
MKPDRQTAIGKVCAKHPELLGQRYIPNRICIECAKENSKRVYAARELTIGQEITVLRGEINRLKAENKELHEMILLTRGADVRFVRQDGSQNRADASNVKVIRGCV